MEKLDLREKARKRLADYHADTITLYATRIYELENQLDALKKVRSLVDVKEYRDLAEWLRATELETLAKIGDLDQSLRTLQEKVENG